MHDHNAGICSRITALHKYSVAKETFPEVCINYDVDFVLKYPYSENIYVTFSQHRDEWTIQIPTDTNKQLLQAVVFANGQSELEYINNYKDGIFVPINGGGTEILKIWDWIANLLGVTQTAVVDKSVLAVTQTKSISLRLLHMLLSTNHKTWYEKHGYQICDKNRAELSFSARNKFFSSPATDIVALIKTQLLAALGKNMGKYGTMYVWELVTAHSFCSSFPSKMTVEEMLKACWFSDKIIYAQIDDVLQASNDKNFLIMMRPDETFIKKF